MKPEPKIRMRAVMQHGETYLCRADVIEAMDLVTRQQDAEVQWIMTSFIDWFTESTRAPQQYDGSGDA